MNKDFDGVKINMPAGAARAIELLEQNGFEAYIVGGCVRDYLLGKTPGDWDITTSAKPDQVKEIFNKTIDTGIEHGTVTARLYGESYEITTYRIDGDYSDGRHPDCVEFTPNLKEDLLRRDFTINAMAYNPSKGLVDLYGGIDDLNSHTIRCVGSPIQRFSEDALRMLRAVRFAAVLGFDIENETFDAIKELKQNLSLVSHERIQVELTKLLLSNNPEKWALADQTGLTEYIIKEYSTYDDNYKKWILNSIKAAPCDISIRFSLLLSGVDLNKNKESESTKTQLEIAEDTNFYRDKLKAHIKQIMRNLRFDNETMREVVTLVSMRDLKLTDDLITIRRQISKVGTPLYDKYLKFRFYLLDSADKDLFERQVNGFECIRASADAVCIKDLKISGSDLIELGFKQGKEIGSTLQKLLDAVLENPGLNTKEQLIELIENK